MKIKNLYDAAIEAGYVYPAWEVHERHLNYVIDLDKYEIIYGPELHKQDEYFASSKRWEVTGPPRDNSSTDIAN